MAVLRRRDGRPAPAGPQRQRRAAAAELVVSRGMTAQRSGEEGRRSRCGAEVRPGARPACREAVWAAWAQSSQRERRRSATTAAEHSPSHTIRPAQPSGRAHANSRSTSMPSRPPTPGARQAASARPTRVAVKHFAPALPDQARATAVRQSEAISASGALNRPRLSSGGTTASTASSFSLGSMRR